MTNKKCKNCGRVINNSSHYCSATSETVQHDYSSDIFTATLIASTFNSDYGNTSDYSSSSDYGSSSSSDFGGGDFGGGGAGGDF